MVKKLGQLIARTVRAWKRSDLRGKLVVFMGLGFVLCWAIALLGNYKLSVAGMVISWGIAAFLFKPNSGRRSS